MGNTNESEPREPFMTPADIARELAVSLGSARRIMRRMPHVRDGRIVRVRRSDFEAWLKAQTKPGVQPVRRETHAEFLRRIELSAPKQIRPARLPATTPALPQQQVKPTRTRETRPFETRAQPEPKRGRRE